mmetsp:Transcript_8986/g.11921  ORF Transcript_8986/g.11921 Transcript_8986/m.11921 type:complete len:523 (+) Transcript_8986:69-1637(+)
MMPVLLPFKVAFCAFIVATGVKILLIGTYKSTDFEVHRNWLAITYSLPLKEWYFESTSQWTLDYPPAFAYFEWVLARFAPLFDKGIVTTLSAAPYDTEATVLFQRSTVMVTDFVLFFGALQAARAFGQSAFSALVCASLIILSPGLLFVDHMHFQYNGFLLGILLLSLAFLAQGRYILGGALYALLVTLKHLYLPLAPVYFVYLLKVFVVGKAGACWQDRLGRLIALGSVVLLIFAAAFAPFLIQDNPKEQMAQMLIRLFPFGRGLCHAYWAPNIWALYMFADRVALVCLKKFQLASPEQMLASSTGGLVHDLPPAVLPRISPALCMALVILSIVPALVIIWQKPKPRTFAWGLIFASLMAFFFGYHVHEKAILTALIPMALLACDSQQSKHLFLQFSKFATFAIHPLLPRVETLNKVVLFLSYTTCAKWALDTAIQNSSRAESKKDLPSSQKSILETLDSWTTVFLSLVFIFTEAIHPIFFRQSDGTLIMEFIPYMMTSVFCGIFFIFVAWPLVWIQLLKS